MMGKMSLIWTDSDWKSSDATHKEGDVLPERNPCYYPIRTIHFAYCIVMFVWFILPSGQLLAYDH